MLNFELDQEQKMLTGAIGRLAQERMRKVSRDADEEGRIPPEVVQAGWDLGLLPAGIAEEHGGLGEYSVITNALAVEELAFGDLAITAHILAPNNIAVPVMLAGTEAQKEAHLPLFCEAAMPQVTAAMQEPGLQYDARHLQTTAVLEDDHYVLNGRKSLAPLADTAETFLIYANENGQTQAFFVPAGAIGLEVGEREKLMGLKALPTFPLTLSNVRVPVVNRLGGDRGLNMDLILNHGRVALGAAAVGVARAGYEYALQYAKQRVQFGEPIAHRQSIAFMLAEMAIDIDGARLMVWEAAWLLDQAKEATRETAVMKHFSDDMVLRVADQALQILGGYGYMREYPVEMWLRNARGFVQWDGLLMV